MGWGRKPLDENQKRERRQASLAKYAEKNRAALANSDDMVASHRKKLALKAAARYRERNREAIRAADTVRRARQYIKKEGLEAFDEKSSRKYLTKTQRRNEGRPALPRPLKPMLHKAPKPSKNRPRASSPEDDGDSKVRCRSPPAVFPGRTLLRERALPPCPAGCDDAGCEGCACLCEFSSDWLAHEHYRTNVWRAAGCP
ncbi:hypothetical protein FB451DRAFT_1401860 [Mycena latifolia]|nr:hypothetical protein FB451DRAFT_1401860 [Mycena latifolia]